jgi:hypothetical protein
MGITFSILDETRWNDMSAVDVLLAVRSFDGQTYDKKPPSKLINGWLAGVPVIAGGDSAYSQIGTPQRDYIVVDNERETIAAIKNLKENRQRYEELVSSGREKAKLFSRAHVADAWQMTLGELDRRYDSWRRKSHVANVAWTAVVWHHAAAKQLAKWLR